MMNQHIFFDCNFFISNKMWRKKKFTSYTEYKYKQDLVLPYVVLNNTIKTLKTQLVMEQKNGEEFILFLQPRRHTKQRKTSEIKHKIMCMSDLNASNSYKREQCH